MKRTVLALLAAFTALPVSAQISLDELSAGVEERVASLNSFEDALNDSDPRRALAAMQLMIEKGDADQRRMALRMGLSSTDLAIRTEALRAYFNSNPTFNIELTLLSEEGHSYYWRRIKDQNGTIIDGTRGAIPRKLSGFDAEADCWQVAKKGCWVRLIADKPSVWFADGYVPLTLGPDGTLRGQGTSYNTRFEMAVPLWQ